MIPQRCEFNYFDLFFLSIQRDENRAHISNSKASGLRTDYSLPRNALTNQNGIHPQK